MRGFGHRLPGPAGSARNHRGMHRPYGEDRRSPTNRQCLDGCDHLIPADRNSRPAFFQVEELSRDRQRLVFGGITTTWQEANQRPSTQQSPKRTRQKTFVP
jgi:hypothetical protein